MSGCFCCLSCFLQCYKALAAVPHRLACAAPEPDFSSSSPDPSSCWPLKALLPWLSADLNSCSRYPNPTALALSSPQAPGPERTRLRFPDPSHLCCQIVRGPGLLRGWGSKRSKLICSPSALLPVALECGQGVLPCSWAAASSCYQHFQREADCISMVVGRKCPFLGR